VDAPNTEDELTIDLSLFSGHYPYDWMYNVTEGSNGYTAFYGLNNPGYTNGVGYSNTTGNGSIWGGGFAAQILISQTQPGPHRGFSGSTRRK
jgi:hypothetical protein